MSVKDRDENFIDELYSGIRGGILDRLSSPLISSFLIAWSLFNYPVFLIVLSEADINQKMVLLETYFSNVVLFIPLDAYTLNFEKWIIRGIFLPSLSVYLYLYQYPKLATIVSLRVLSDQLHLKTEKNLLQGKALKSPEEVESIIARFETVNNRNKRIIHELQQENDVQQNSIASLETKLEQATKEAQAHKFTNVAPPVQPLAKHDKDSLKALTYLGAQYDKGITRVDSTKIFKFMGLPNSRLTTAIQKLLDKRFIRFEKARPYDDVDAGYFLTPEGLAEYVQITEATHEQEN